MRKRPAGQRKWVIPDCYLPEKSTGGLASHESTCVLNLGTRAASLVFTAYFEDRPPIQELLARCPSQRTMHIRISSLRNLQGQSVPKGVPFALAVESNVPVVVQHTRLDSTQPALALMTTMAFPVR
jgi:hypothetical protein